MMAKMMTKRRGEIVWGAILALGLAAVSANSAAQSRNQFRGIWSGTFSPDVAFGVPEEDVERLSQPVQVELRIFNRGRTELVFTSEHDEWAFDGRDLVLTELGYNGVILGRLQGKNGSQNGFSLNLTAIDDETLLVNWSKVSTRANLRFDGLDELAFAGTDELELTD